MTTFKVGSRVLACGKHLGTIIDVCLGTYSVEFDGRMKQVGHGFRESDLIEVPQ